MPAKAKTAAKKTAPRKTAAPQEREAGKGYTRVPVSDVWATDAEVEGKAHNQIYDWVGIADKAITKPDTWLLVAEGVPSSVASNITQLRIKALLTDRYLGWSFRGRVTDMTMNPDTGRYNRGKVWIKATRTGVR